MRKSTSKNPVANHPVASPKARSPHAVLARDELQEYDGDGYTPNGHYPDNTVCSRCGAVYQNQHWTLDEKRRDMLLAAGTPNEVVCPGCKKIAERNPQGIVTLRGDYWPTHREEILNLIKNEEIRGIQTNPLERIMDIREEDGCLVIETTNEKLAQRIGRHVDRAHSGSLEFKWSGGNHLVRVEWERPLHRER
jgi:hypothetical protein